MLVNLIQFEVTCQQATPSVQDLKKSEQSITVCIDYCKLTLEKLTKLLGLFDASCNQVHVGTKIQTKKGMSFNVAGKLKNKKTLKKVQKLKEFANNSYSYLQVILFQCKV